ncbi:VLRF1 family aeRF1-type release factor [Oceanobacillus sp. CAU 1775]
MAENMGITETIKWLEDVKTDGVNKIFTMYLNTDRSATNKQGDEWKIHFKNGMRNFEKYLQQDDNNEELDNFLKVKKKVTDYMKEEEASLQRGVVIYATADDEIWFARKVQMNLDSEFYWQEEPELNQLRNLKEKYPKLGVVLVQQNQIKVIKSESNRILDTVNYELDIETEDWKIKKGPRPATMAGSRGPNVQKDNFQSRYAANMQRWYKQIAPKLDKLAKDSNWEQLYVVGEADVATELSSLLNKPVDRVVQKNMLDHDEMKVLDEVRSE